MADFSSGMDEFCGQKYWEWDLTWYTDNPDLTQCFQNTALLWVPCAFLWVFSVFEAHYLIHSIQRNIPWTALSTAKCLINLMLIVIQAVDFWFALDRRSYAEIFLVDLLTPLIKFLTFLLALCLILMNKRRGMRSSGILFIFWLLMTLTGGVTYRSFVSKAVGEDVIQEEAPFVIYMIYYPLVAAMLLLNCWADAEPQVLLIKGHKKQKKPCPGEASSYLSRITFSWFEKTIWKGYKKPLHASDTWDLNVKDGTRYIFDQFEKHWQQSLHKDQVKTTLSPPSSPTKATFSKNSANVDFAGPKTSLKKNVSILPALIKTFGPSFFVGAAVKFVQDTLTFVNPQILKLLIGYVGSEDETWKGYFYIALMLVSSLLITFLSSQYMLRMTMIGMRVRAALIPAIYRKALRVSNAARKESTVGEIVNLMSVDSQLFMDLIPFLCMLWSTPYLVALSMYFLWQNLGPSVLSGLAVMILVVPFNGLVAKKLKGYQMTQMKLKDERVKLMNEVLSGMKVLKLYAWEPSFQEQVMTLRNKEIAMLKKAAYFTALLSFAWSCTPFMVALASFATYVFVDENNVLDASTAFVSLTLFNILYLPLGMLAILTVSVVQTSVSLKRINKFMNSEELDETSVCRDSAEIDPLVMENATFRWTKDDPIVLRNVNLRVKPGFLVAVVGSVGSGKSSLLSAILGEMENTSGKVMCKGRIAYVQQQAWIQNASLRDNILFGKSMDSSLYDKVVEACALKPDLEMLPGGDNIEIGEKGINLSGGQKQRVSLARAVYNDADLYLLDDPLSAVDSHVGKHIFENVIGPQSILKNKTRVLVTHGITYLPNMDHIIVLKDGEVSEVGTYKELLEIRGAFAEFLMQHLAEHVEEESEELVEVKQQLISAVGAEEFQRQLSRQRSLVSESRSDASSDGHLDRIKPRRDALLRRRSSVMSQGKKDNAKEAPKQKVGEKLIETERTETGGVKYSVYVYYLKAVGLMMIAWIIWLNMASQGFSIGTNLWLSVWSNEPVVNGTQDPSKRDMYLGVYGVLGVGQAISVVLATLILALSTLHGSNVIHLRMLVRIFRSPMSFFDTTPIGRIVNRFGKDVDVCDNTIPFNIRLWMNCLFSVLATITVISITTPIFIAAIVPIAIAYYFIQSLFLATTRQFQRFESVSRSPIYSHFSETVTGASTIRAYRQQERFIAESDDKVDVNDVFFHSKIIASRWLAIRLECVGNLVIFFASLFAVLGRDTLNPGLVGLSVSYALQITMALNMLVRTTSDVETNIVAAERMKEYGEVPQEAPWEVPEKHVNKSWPQEGIVEFVGYQTRYREGLDLVLRGISCKIEGGEKVGIVGRTGAGKSSLTLALFRMIEAAGGSILIDGEDISKLGLHDVRGRLTIIPQDPVLFSGSLRVNLDPFNQYSDAELWQALEHAHLKSFVKSLPAVLNHEVTEGGENLSVGQRQLVCLARALLRKTKVLLLDEATAAVDLETDDLLQNTIRKEFSDCTVITIAHRLNTIMDSNRVLVLDKGEIREFDSPSNLLLNKDSMFYSMAHDAGLI